MNKRRLIVSIIETILGVSLIICSEIGIMDSFWSGMGAGLIVVGVMNTVRGVRYKTNAAYKEKFDTEVNDERNRYISMKAWSWTGYLLVFVFAIATIVFKIAGNENMMVFASGVVCLILILYWISYCILRKKY